MTHETLGIYLSVPFCRAKCSFCNFASGVFAAERMDGYVDRLCAEIRGAQAAAAGLGATLPGRVDTVYFGGGTPSLLGPGHFEKIFAALRGEFTVDADAEATLEAAPGQVDGAALEAAMLGGVNRVSFGVQTFVDAEAAAVGRTHTGRECREEIARTVSAGVRRVGLDLIVGLPHQTEESWRHSVGEAVGSGVEHVSVYMLEVDDGSRLGREALAGGSRYGVGALPEEDRAADRYLAGCERLERAGFRQYEISNFASVGGASRHNLKYWRREGYLGFGMDAHSMLRMGEGAVRWANADEMETYMAGVGRVVDRIGLDGGFEEALFLGLRLNEGVDLEALREDFGDRVEGAEAQLREVEMAGLVAWDKARWRLTGAGRLASNEVFGRLLAA